jgi:hypothetical protein
MHDSDIRDLNHRFMESNIVLTAKKEGKVRKIKAVRVPGNKQCSSSIGLATT